jgi:hypothetical protein
MALILDITAHTSASNHKWALQINDRQSASREPCQGVHPAQVRAQEPGAHSSRESDLVVQYGDSNAPVGKVKKLWTAPHSHSPFGSTRRRTNAHRRRPPPSGTCRRLLRQRNFFGFLYSVRERPGWPGLRLSRSDDTHQGTGEAQGDDLKGKQTRGDRDGAGTADRQS